jgi:hypothetical protein
LARELLQLRSEREGRIVAHEQAGSPPKEIDAKPPAKRAGQFGPAFARWTIGEIREHAAGLFINGAAYKTRTELIRRITDLERRSPGPA